MFPVGFRQRGRHFVVCKPSEVLHFIAESKEIDSHYHFCCLNHKKLYKSHEKPSFLLVKSPFLLVKSPFSYAFCLFRSKEIHNATIKNFSVENGWGFVTSEELLAKYGCHWAETMKVWENGGLTNKHWDFMGKNQGKLPFYWDFMGFIADL